MPCRLDCENWIAKWISITSLYYELRAWTEVLSAEQLIDIWLVVHPLSVLIGYVMTHGRKSTVSVLYGKIRLMI